MYLYSIFINTKFPLLRLLPRQRNMLPFEPRSKCVRCTVRCAVPPLCDACSLHVRCVFARLLFSRRQTDALPLRCCGAVGAGVGVGLPFACARHNQLLCILRRVKSFLNTKTFAPSPSLRTRASETSASASSLPAPAVATVATVAVASPAPSIVERSTGVKEREFFQVSQVILPQLQRELATHTHTQLLN